MKLAMVLVLIMVTVIGVCPKSEAALIDRGGGLIYDTDLNVTWLQDANYAFSSGYGYSKWLGGMLDTFAELPNFISNLSYYDSVRNVTWDDWRLPSSGKVACDGYNCTTSELGHLYYTELNNPAGGPIVDSGPFFNIATGFGGAYKLKDEAPVWNINLGWFFVFNSGDQVELDASGFAYVWPVRDGDVGTTSVPEPSTLLLLLFGILSASGKLYFKVKPGGVVTCVA
jgi:hypothetical protein